MLRTRRTRSRALVAGVEALEARQVPAALLVSNVLDAGPGSLRQAIVDANADPDASQIGFAIPGAGVRAIQLTAPLPTITAPLAIDATTQPGYEGTPIVALDGAQAGIGDGLSFAYSGDPSSVDGLAIGRFRGDGIRVNSVPVVIRRAFIGLDPTGAGGGGNLGAGVSLSGGGGSVVGGLLTDANVIANNGGDGVTLTSTSNVRVTNNFIGTDATGRAELGNGGNGVTIGDFYTDSYVGSNVIAYNGGLAVLHKGYFLSPPSVVGPNLDLSNGRNLPDFAVDASTTAVSGSTGDLRTISYTVTNRGPGAATNVRFLIVTANAIQYFDRPPAPFIFQYAGATTTRGVVNPNADPNWLNSNLIATIDTLAAGDSATITVTVRLSNTGDDALSATVRADQPTISSVAPATTITARAAIDLAATALPGPDRVRIGSPVALTFQVTNRNALATALPDVALALPGPDVATVLSVNSSRGTLTAVDGRPGIYAGRIADRRPGAGDEQDLIGLAAGESATITVVLVPLRAGPILAYLATSVPINDDPDAANNLAFAGTVAEATPAVIAVAPTLTSVALVPARGGAIRSVVLGFNLALDRSRAEDVENYRLTTGGRPLGLRSATYDAATGRVTLRLARPLATRGTPIRVRLIDGRSVGLVAADGSTPVAGAVVAASRPARVVAARRARP